MPTVSDPHETDTNTGPLKCRRTKRTEGRKPSVGQADLNRYGLPATTRHCAPVNTYMNAYIYICIYICCTRTYLNKTLSQDNAALCAITGGDGGQLGRSFHPRAGPECLATAE